MWAGCFIVGREITQAQKEKSKFTMLHSLSDDVQEHMHKSCMNQFSVLPALGLECTSFHI